MDGPASPTFAFGPFCLDPGKRLLRRGEQPVALSSKAFDALVLLVSNQGRVIERDEMIKQIWPDSFVEEANLNVCISTLRKALGESVGENRFIVTVPGRGYCFAARQAHALDPLSIFVNSFVGLTYHFARRYDDAIAICHKSLAIDPDYAYAHRILAMTYEAQGDYQSALSEYQKAIRASDESRIIAHRSYLQAVAGCPDEARKLLDQLRQGAHHPGVSPFSIAMIYAGLNEKDQTFAWLEKAYEEHDYRLTHLNVSTRMDSLRRDPRFDRLRRRLGFA